MQFIITTSSFDRRTVPCALSYAQSISYLNTKTPDYFVKSVFKYKWLFELCPLQKNSLLREELISKCQFLTTMAKRYLEETGDKRKDSWEAFYSWFKKENTACFGMECSLFNPVGNNRLIPIVGRHYFVNPKYQCVKLCRRPKLSMFHASLLQ